MSNILKNRLSFSKKDSFHGIETMDLTRLLQVSKKNALNLSLLLNDDSSSSFSDVKPLKSYKVKSSPKKNEKRISETKLPTKDASTNVNDSFASISPIKHNIQIQTLDEPLKSLKRESSIQTSFIEKENCILCDPNLKKTIQTTQGNTCALCLPIKSSVNHLMNPNLHDKGNENIPDLTQSFATQPSSDKSCLFINETSMMKSLADIVLEMDNCGISDSQKSDVIGPVDKLNDIIQLLNFL